MDDHHYCPMCDFPNDPEALRCRACGWVLLTYAEASRLLLGTAEEAQDDA